MLDNFRRVEMLEDQYEKLMAEHESMREALRQIDNALWSPLDLNDYDGTKRFRREVNNALQDVWERHGPIYR